MLVHSTSKFPNMPINMLIGIESANQSFNWHSMHPLVLSSQRNQVRQLIGTSSANYYNLKFLVKVPIKCQSIELIGIDWHFSVG